MNSIQNSASDPFLRLLSVHADPPSPDTTVCRRQFPGTYGAAKRPVPASSAKQVQRGLLLACFGLALFFASPVVRLRAADSAEYSGVVIRSVLAQDGNARGTPSVYTFRAEVAPDRYRITRKSVSGLGWFDETAGSDGLDCYFLRQRWPSWKDKQSNAGYSEEAQVSPGLFPSLASSEVQLLWVLLASHKGVTNGQPLALTHIRDAPYDKLQARIQYAARGEWPESVEVFSPGSGLFEGKEYPLPPPFQNGYKLWDFSSKASGETNGFIYPTEATFYQYSVFDSLNGGQATIRSILRIEISVTNVAVGASPPDRNYLPVLSETNLMVNDFRFSPHLPRPNTGPVSSIEYRLPEGRWLDRSNPTVHASGMSVLVETRLEDRMRAHSGRRHVLLFVLIALTVVPLLVVLRAVWSKRNRSSN